MTRNIWIISDLHLNHKNSLVFKNRDGSHMRSFADVDEMNETIIDNWNKTVSEGDIVYNLGDVFFGSPDQADILLERLNGKKRLILGNHDILEKKHTAVYVKHFQKIMVWRMFTEFGFLATHVPVHSEQFEYKGLKNCHGHVHGNNVLDPVTGLDDPRYINVCVEKINYTPVHVEDLRKRIRG